MNSRLVVVGPNKFRHLDAERDILAPLGAELTECRSNADLVRYSPDADVVMLGAAPAFDSHAIARLRQCRAIIRYGVGVDNIDLEAAKAAAVPVANVPDASIDEVAEHCLTLALALLRRLPTLHAATARGEWPIGGLRGSRRFSRLTCGIVGLGRIGDATAARFAALGFDILGHDPAAGATRWPRVGLDELLRRSDVVSLHVPLTSATRHLLDEQALRLMRPDSVLVNAARGGVIDESALARLLHEGALGGAALDAFEQEPLEASNPLCTSPRTLLTPHLAWYSEDALDDLQRKAAQEAARALEGKPLANRVA